MKTFSGHKPSQNAQELDAFIALLKAHNVMRYLEVGARHGDTFHAIMSSLPEGATGIAVDMPGGLWGTRKSQPALIRAVADLNRRGYWCSTLFGNSHTLATRQLISARGPYDAILIDGDHSLAGVTMDWELYGSMAPLVAFHDIAGEGQCDKPTGTPVEVPILWKKLREHSEVREFVADGSRMGIGVICNSI